MHKSFKTIVPFFLGLSFLLAVFLTSCKPALDSRTAIQKQQQPIDVLSSIKETGTLRVGTTGDFVPFSYFEASDTGQYSGIDIELAKDLGKALGVQVRFIKTSWPNLLTDLNASKFDIGMSGITITEKRKETADFSIPMLISGKVAITRDENVARYNSIANINKEGVRVIVNPGGTNEAFARANFPNATLIENEDNISIFQKIVDGEADLMVTDAMETLVQERIHPELEAVNPTIPFNSFQMGYLIPKDSTFKAYLDKWLLLKIKDSTLQKITLKELDKFN